MALLEPQSTAEQCSCGRLNTKPHCASCGRYDVAFQSKLSREHTRLEEGKHVHCDVFKCRVCGHVFDDWDWKNQCEAPRFESKTMRERRIREDSSEKATALLAEANRKGMIARLLKDAGMIKSDPKRVDKGPDIFELERRQHPGGGE